MKGVNDVLESGSWMIINLPIILNKWKPSVSLTKDNDTKVPVWVKMQDVLMLAFTMDSLSAVSMKTKDESHLVHQTTMNLDNKSDEEDVQNVYDETLPSFKVGEYLKPKGKALPLIKYPMYNIMLWNIRGLNRTPKQNEVHQVINEHNLKVCGIIESHVDIGKLDRVCAKVCKNWKWASNCSFYSKGSRIIIGWNDDGVDVMIMVCMNQAIPTQIILKADQELLGVLLYMKLTYI
ncbi:RNA-directed DNA polymerase, eukaryota, reverse transcriptase zinc-binding domain protein [Tanacetum coccineum]